MAPKKPAKKTTAKKTSTPAAEQKRVNAMQEMVASAGVEHQLNGRTALNLRAVGRGVAERLLELHRRQDTTGGRRQADVSNGRVGMREHLHVLRVLERGLQRLREGLGCLMKLRKPLGLRHDEVNRRHCRGRRVRGKRRGEAVARAGEALMRDDPCRARAEAADGRERVLHRSDEHIDALWRHVVVLGDAAARLAHRSEGQRLVDDEIATKGITKADQLGEWA